MMSIKTLLADVRLLPVLVINELEQALPLAKALMDAGFTAIEVTLRSPCASEAIRLIKAECPDLIVGAGTVTDKRSFATAMAAGSDFLVSPGFTSNLAEVARTSDVPLIPGVATPSEAMLASDMGYELLKLFPAEAVGGRALLKSIAGPLPDIRFCPTGGITADSAPDYLELPNVFCVGGSWMVPGSLLAARDWQGITNLAREALAACAVDS